MRDNEIRDNLEYVKEIIKKSTIKSKRLESEVTLIAVSKTKPIEDLLIAYNLGVRDFGENKVQEILQKFDQMPSDTRFHMIGHLQRNKVKYIVDKVCLIHSVDNLELAKTISKEAKKKNLTMDICIEVNVAKEDSKFGIFTEDLIVLVKEISLLENIRIVGLMTVAPYVDNPEENRQYFVDMKRLSIDINNQNIDNVIVGDLSMGMTNDYAIAIEEGATYVRVGTGIFGARNYSKNEETS